MTYFRTFTLQAPPPPESKKGPAKLHDYLNDAYTAPARIRRCDEGTGDTKETDFQRPGRRVGSTGYLHLHMLNTSRKNALLNR